MEKELQDICEVVLGLLDKHLIPKASSGESKVFYLKMKGDYFRYLAEVATGTKRKEIMNESQEAYKAAFEVAQKEMPVSYSLIWLQIQVYYSQLTQSVSVWP